jgi:hypothetical protein
LTLVLVGGSDLDTAVHVFEGAGFDSRRASAVAEQEEGDWMVALEGDVAAALLDADRRSIRYVLVHVGSDDGSPGGSYARAHHRVGVTELPALAAKLRSRERMLVTCLAFGYKRGLPASADWVVDTRFLENPYWVEELRDLTGLDEQVRQFVLRQPAALDLIESLQGTLESLVPLYRAQGRNELTVSFGCTGGRHRSVAMASEMARRLEGMDGIEIVMVARDL